MIIKHVKVENFRGIKTLDWHVDGRLVCLLGPGDSTKTTILDAIELALIPRWTFPFCDADFYRADTNASIRIQVTVGELGDDLLGDERCGLYLRGYDLAKSFRGDPDDDCESVVTIQLQVDGDLEPRWEIVKDGVLEPKTISWRERERLCMARLGDDVERHLTWSKGSSLSRITDKSIGVGPMLAQVNRAANDAFLSSSTAELDKVAEARCY